MGWIQGGYDDFFGSSAGLGIRLSQKVAISYVYETGKNDLGPTSELGIVYSFSKKPTNTITYNTPPKTKIDTTEENLINTEAEKNDAQKNKKDTINSKQIKIVKNEDDVLSINKKITALQNQIDSLKAINKTKSIRNEKDSISLKNKIEEFQNQKDSLSIENKNKKLQNEKDSISIKDKIKFSKMRKDSIAEVKKKTAVLPKMEIIKKTEDLEEGFYLIVNVFSQEKYANSFVENLKENDLNPKYFIHPIKKYRYVYISYSKSKREILKLIYNNVNGKYVHDKWILQVEN